jgi:hypothetical protein
MIAAGYSDDSGINGKVLSIASVMLRVDPTLAPAAQLRLARLIGAPTTKVVSVVSTTAGYSGGIYETQFIMDATQNSGPLAYQYYRSTGNTPTLSNGSL